ncbi:ATP-binding protein [Catenulispora subtropica]|uniref:ATP-binding protein n=1 Tax=Catenulispora subtropica TaxID=450798 RepID=A0ABN2SYR7_9ACTN
MRLHLAQLLVDAGAGDSAIAELAVVLQQDPGSGEARALMMRAMGVPAAAPEPLPPTEPSTPATDSRDAFDWDAADAEFDGVVAPMFVDGVDGVGGDDPEPAFDLEPSTVRLADVGGMADVKKRLEVAFLAPMRNPELSKLYGKSLKGGLLLYGPPGCGKTFIARAVAGELGARFYAVTLADVLDMYIGQSERNLHEVFEVARRNAPCVLFLDEVDAIGQKRTQIRGTGMRGTVNQLLAELDGADGRNEGVFVLAATNHPWDVDSALKRPGRLDRTLLVLPPDEAARQAILRFHLRDRPVSGVDVKKLAKRLEGYSGADIAHVCDTAAENALMASAAAGEVRMIGQRDLDAACEEVGPSIGPWLETARNVALYANENGAYDDLLAYLKKRKHV